MNNRFFIIHFLVLVPLLMLLPRLSNAFFPMSWSDLNFQMRYQAQWYRVRLENRIEIFDPFENKMGEMGKKIPRLMPERDYLTKKSEHREQALREFNIEDFLVSQTWHENQIYYRIGIQGSDHYALIDPKTFFLQSLHSSIQRANGSKWKLEVKFSKFKKYNRQEYPQITEYFLDGNLFKRVRLIKAKTLSRLPIKELKEMAMARVETLSATWKVDYAR